MDNASYVVLSRQSGLWRAFQTIAHNIANVETTGFRREDVLFSEFVRRLEGVEPSLSMAAARARQVVMVQGEISATGGALDFAIEGEGFFRVATPWGERLTRAGHFALNADGTIVTPEGHALLDESGAPIVVPPGVTVSLASDGTLSADGEPLARIGVVRVDDPAALRREGGVLLVAEAPVEPAEGAVLFQGMIEGSNVDPVLEMARMIAVQRAYEAAQTFLDREDQRIRTAIQTLSR